MKKYRILSLFVLVISFVAIAPSYAAPLFDVDDSDTVLLLHMDGANNSTTFTDESGKTVTVNGDAKITTAQSYFGGASGTLDGTGDYLTLADSNDWYQQTFTVDFRVRWNAITDGTTQTMLAQRADANNRWAIYLDRIAGGTNNDLLGMTVWSGGSNLINYSTVFEPSLNTWYHLAFVVTSGSIKICVDGTCGSGSGAITFPNIAGVLSIANNGNSGNYLNGWLDELRFSKVARWSASFSTPTAAYAPAATSTPTSTPTNTDTPTNTPTNTSTSTPTDTPTATSTSTSTITRTPTTTLTNTPGATSTETQTETSTATATSTASLTPTSTLTPTITPTVEGVPTWFIGGEITYGDMAVTLVGSIILMTLLLFIMMWLAFKLLSSPRTTRG
jgi:hypothetical protein